MEKETDKFVDADTEVTVELVEKMDSMSWKQISTKYSEIILMVL